MKMHVDAKVLMKGVEIEVSEQDTRKITDDFLSKQKSHMVLHYVMKAWKLRRGVGKEWVVKDGDKLWQEYENNGSHYSGYYDRDEAVTELDRAVYDCYLNLEQALHKFERQLEKSKEEKSER